jgi:Zn-dependent protease
MGWSFPIAEVAGIKIKVHVTFFLILILGAIQWGGPYGATGAVYGVVLMILLFVCVTLHELGHSIVAMRFGVPVREIVLLPLGGVALLSRNAEKPWQELLIAAAGPIVNIVIAVLLFGATGTATALGTLDGSALQENAPPSLSSLLIWLLQANVILVLFNLIPAFPLDGGRMLRAILAMLMPPQRATRIATAIGQVIAIGLGIVGVLTGNFALVLVAIFVFFGAGQENNQGYAQTVLRTLRVGDAYNKYALALAIGDRVSKVADYILTSYQPDFAVLQGNRLVGIVTRDDVLRALASSPEDAYVSGIMQREIVQVAASDTLDSVREQMAEKGTRVVAVYNGERYLGLVSIEDISEAFAVAAFQGRQSQARAAAGLPPLRPAMSGAATPTLSPGTTPAPAQAEAGPAQSSPLQEQLAAKRRRLGALQIQQSYFGARTPAKIADEIRQLQREIDELTQGEQQIQGEQQA